MIGHSPPLWRLFLAASDQLRQRLESKAPKGALDSHVKAPAIEDLCLGGLRAWGLTQVRLARLCDKKPPARELQALLAVVFSCIQRQYRPAPILVDQAVRAAQSLAGQPGGKFVNAVLRAALQDPRAAQGDEQALTALCNAPKEWFDAVAEDWGETQAGEILMAMGQPRGHWLRLVGDADTQKRSLQAIRDWAQERGIAMHAQQNQLPSVWLQSLRGLFDTTLFREGLFRVQDWSAQQLARLWTDSPPRGPQSSEVDRIDVLDVCAAPGGKSFLIAEDPRTRIWAMDKSERRLQKMKSEAERLSRTLDLSRLTVTATDILDDVWPMGFPNQFDCIVLDAPCSASGVMSRHPEIPWTDRLAERESLCRVQSAMLNAVWQRLKPGGKLLYVTCSVFHAEGEHQIDAFLRLHPEARRQAAPGYILPVADSTDIGPGRDGFFYASLCRGAQL